MSLNKYISSETVRNYYNSIDYEISSIVALWIILSNSYRLIEDRHRDLQDLIRNTEDVSLDKINLNVKGVTTLHSLINYLIDQFNKSYDDITKAEEGASYRIYDGNLFDDADNGFLGLFFTYEECAKQIRIRTSNYKNPCYKNLEKWNSTEFVIRKSLPGKYDYMLIRITKNQEIIDIDSYGGMSTRDFMQYLEGFNFDFPLPFEYGDIVRVCHNDSWLNNLVYDGRQYLDNGYTDPFVSCTVLTIESDIYTYLDVNPFELEICDSKEKDIYPLTRLISSFEKREIKVDDFLKEYDLHKKNPFNDFPVPSKNVSFNNEDWKEIVEQIKERYSIRDCGINTWFDGLELIGYSNQVVKIQSRNMNTRDFDFFSNLYKTTFASALSDKIGFFVDVQFVISKEDGKHE